MTPVDEHISVSGFVRVMAGTMPQAG